MPYYREALSKFKDINQNPDTQYANIVHAGQLGVASDLRKIDACTPLALPSIIPVVIHIPNMFKKIQFMPELLKEIIERHAKSITGLEFGYTLEDGEGFTFKDSQPANIPTRTTVSPITPAFTFPDYNGQIIRNFFNNWIEMIIHHETQFSKLSSYLNTEEIDPFVYSWFCMDILWIQFDITWLPQNIVDSFMTINMYPRTPGNFTYKRDVNAAYDIPEVSVEFNSVLKRNENTKLLGIETAKMLQMHKTNFNFAQLAIDDDWDKNVEITSGIKGEMDNILQDWKQYTTGA